MARDHPRSRGVYSSRASTRCRMPGSSPLARGLQCVVTIENGNAGIIPARAGFTACLVSTDPRRWDHPRSRGVYLYMVWVGRSAGGSSPLARGLPRCGHRRLDRARIIPARAGFTRAWCSRPSRNWDHPRSRGVYRSSPRPTPGDSGSSPLARGLRRGRLQGHHGHGIIPARAGFTACLVSTDPSRRDHPRSRGVYRLSASLAALARDHPRSRGVYGWRIRHAPWPAGIIPARAGFTRKPRLVSRLARDHPRSRGVY